MDFSLNVNKTGISISIPQGYDFQFVDKLPDDCVCKICHLALRKPVQTKCCGHRFCKDCLEEANRSKKQPECPMDREKLNLELDVFADKAAERTLSSLVIKCPSEGCKWQGELGNIKPHEQKCDYMMVKCSNQHCGVMKPRMKMTNHLEQECEWREVLCPHCKKTHKFCELENHLTVCAAFPVSCPNECGEEKEREKVEDHISNKCPMSIVPCIYQEFGCMFETSRKSIDQHLEKGVKDHLKITVDCLKLLQHENITFKGELSKKEKDIFSLSSNIQNVLKEMKKEKAEKESIKQQCSSLTSDIKTLRKEKTTLENTVKNFTKNMNQRCNNLTENIKTAARKDKESLQKQVNDLTKKLESTFVWKFENFQESLTQAKKGGEEIVLLSNPFYTEEFGYKLQAQLYPNGNGKGKNTHVSVFLIVLEGKYDAILTWPLKRKISLSLLDQKANLSERKNIQNSFVPDQTMGESFLRPQTPSNIPRGYHTFVSHKDLVMENYLVDDAIFLQIKVEP